MKKLFGLSALVSPRVPLGVGLIVLTSLFGGTGCGLSYTLTGLYIIPETGLTCVPPNAFAQFNAYGTYTEGGHTTETKNLSDTVSWSATLPQLATVSGSGLAQASTSFVGLTSIIATTPGEFGNLTAESSLEVSTQCTGTGTSVKTPSLHIVPGIQTLAVGHALQPLAIATYGNHVGTADVTGKTTWETSDAKVATVDAGGLITAAGSGDAVITAQTRDANGEVISAVETIHVGSKGQGQ